MELQDFEIEDLDAEDEEEFTESSEGSGSAKRSATKVLMIIGGNVLVILLVIVVLGVVGFVNGKIQLVDNIPDADKPLYTESQMKQLVQAAKDDAQASKEMEIDGAYNNGFSIGQNSLLDYIKDTLMTNNSSLETFNKLYPDHFIVVSNGRYNFLQINKNLKLCELVQDRIVVSENGEMQYTDEAGNVISHKGIDVSEYQGDINWSKVAADGVEFAIIRAYYRGYGSGKIVRDAKVDQNIQGAIDNGIHVGVYIFSQAINRDEAVEEAELAIETLEPYATNVPIVIDVERVAGANPRMDALSVEERTDVILAFCDTVINAGYIPIIYYNTEMGGLYVDLEKLEGISKWYAWYGSWLYYPYDYDIWQYKDTGKVNGINGNVDMNIAIRPFW
ncbi:MAG: glycoside hydrolase family 25 protein [Lachnospiraceae bacterium]|nr:glycoside hydrolase family 25 protein [Lachnospiraceae bacterium]